MFCLQACECLYKLSVKRNFLPIIFNAGPKPVSISPSYFELWAIFYFLVCNKKHRILQINRKITCLSLMLMVKLSKHLKSCSSSIRHDIYTTTMSKSTKWSRVVTYPEGNPPIKSYDPLVIWSFKIMWQTKTIIHPLPQSLWPPNLAGWWYAIRSSHP